MANQTAAREASKKPGEIVSYLMAGSSIGTIWKGSLVFTQHANTPTSEGYAGNTARSVASNGDVFLGVAYESVDNSTGADGAKRVRVNKRGVYRFTHSGLTQVNVGSKAYASDNQTVTTTSTNNIYVGDIEEIIDTTTVAVRIDHAVA
jgi:hypothetical protein